MGIVKKNKMVYYLFEGTWGEIGGGEGMGGVFWDRDKLISKGYRISDKLYNQILARNNEVI